MTVLHILNLDTIGGVESLFVHFLEQAHSLKHHVLVTGGPIHPFFQDTVQRFATSIFYEKYLFGLKMPKCIRPLLSKRALTTSLSTVILWNRFDAIEPPTPDCRVIYYEHGASWIHPQGTIQSAFFDSKDLLIANSFAAKRMMECKWGVKKPISVVVNPLRPDLPLCAEARTGCAPKVRLGYIGRLIPLKGVCLLLHALKGLHNLHIPASLTIAGEGSERHALEGLSSKLGLQEEVHFLSAVSDVARFYDNIDVLLIPSIREPLGLIALEAAARGCPVIAAHVDGLPEAVGEGAGYLVEPTIDIAQYPEYGGTLDKLPDCVFDPVHNCLTAPKLCAPDDIAVSVARLIDAPHEYARCSYNALMYAHKRPGFQEYTNTIKHSMNIVPEYCSLTIN